MRPLPAETYFAGPRDPAVREVVEMFGPTGNFVDFHLGAGAGTENTTGQLRWVPGDKLVRATRQLEIDGWSPDEDVAIALIKHDTERGGGLKGASPMLAALRARMMVFGETALAQERRLADRKKQN